MSLSKVIKQINSRFFKIYHVSRRNYANTGSRKGLVIGCYDYDMDCEEPALTKAAQCFNDSVGGRVVEIIKQSGKKIKLGKDLVMHCLNDEYYCVCLVGVGPEKAGYNENEAIDEGLENVREAAGLGAQKLHRNRVDSIAVEGFGGFAEQSGEGAALALYRYQEFKNKKFFVPIPTLELYQDNDEEGFHRGLFRAESQNFARRLSDCPANCMTPLHFAQEAVNELCPCGIRVFVRGRDWIENKRFDIFLTVARGSCEPPIILEVSYCGGPRDLPPILMVPKGITFDSGGLCLKTYKGQDAYRCDMIGAAATLAAIRAAAALNLPINIEAIVPLCENMPSGQSMKCGDVVMAKNNKSVCIVNTDNEGRLIMVDPLLFGQKVYNPRLIITVASLTSGACAALGSGPSAVFTNSQTMWKQVRKAGVISGDRVWRLPLWKDYTKNVTRYTSHDVDNKGYLGPYAEAGLGAAFLNEFIECVDWIHFDCKGVGFIVDHKVKSYLLKGAASGRPTRTLIQLLHQLACPNEAERELVST